MARRELPLSLHASLYGDGDATGFRRDEIESAARDVNQRLGLAALVVVDGSPADVEVVMSAPAGDGWEQGGHSELTVRGGLAVRCDVRFSNVASTGDLELLVLEHELGHCLGLAHDESRQSIMRRVQSPTPAGQLPPWISDADRSALRSLYVRRLAPRRAA